MVYYDVYKRRHDYDCSDFSVFHIISGVLMLCVCVIS